MKGSQEQNSPYLFGTFDKLCIWKKGKREVNGWPATKFEATLLETEKISM